MIRHDLLGRELVVVKAANDALVGLAGRVVDETTHTLRIRTERGEKVLIKEQAVIEVDGLRINGALLNTRPEKRTKLKIRKWQRKKPQR